MYDGNSEGCLEVDESSCAARNVFTKYWIVHHSAFHFNPQ